MNQSMAARLPGESEEDSSSDGNPIGIDAGAEEITTQSIGR